MLDHPALSEQHVGHQVLILVSVDHLDVGDRRGDYPTQTCAPRRMAGLHSRRVPWKTGRPLSGTQDMARMWAGPHDFHWGVAPVALFPLVFACIPAPRTAGKARYGCRDDDPQS